MSYVLIFTLFMFFLHFGPAHLESYSFEPPNLKTILFKETHLMPRCWSSHEVTLLLNRRVMQDIIPRKIPRDLPMVLQYLKDVEDITSKVPPGINQTLVMMAMADVIGGYLQAIVIPIANEAYYAGNVDYKTVAELHGMLHKWKWYLSTDGGPWSQECDMRKIPTKVAIIELKLSDPQAACQELYVSPPSPFNETGFYSSQSFVPESSRVAIPYFDNNMSPNAIALPFKKRNLYSLQDPNSAYILVRYYNLAMRCLSGNHNDVLAFNNFFHLWIVTKVVPHLHDPDKWYPAFGAVMRVVETIKQKGLASSNSVFYQPLGDEHQDAALNANLDVGGSSKYMGKSSSYFYLLNNPYALQILFLFFLLIVILGCCLCMLCCLRCRKKNKKQSASYCCGADDNAIKNVLFSLYFGLKDSLGASGSRLVSDSSAVRNVEQQMEPSVRETKYSGMAAYPLNTPYTNAIDSSNVSITLSDSEEEFSSES